MIFVVCVLSDLSVWLDFCRLPLHAMLVDTTGHLLALSQWELSPLSSHKCQTLLRPRFLRGHGPLYVVYKGGHNKILQTGWLKTTDMCSLAALETGSPKSRRWQDWFLLRASAGESAPCLSLSCWWLPAILNVPWLVDAFLQFLCASSHGVLHLCLCVFSWPS